MGSSLYLKLGVLIAALVLFSGAILYVGHLRSANARLTSQVSVLTSNLLASNNSIATLQNSIKSQNDAINNLKAQADSRVLSHQSAIADSAKNGLKLANKAAVIIAAKPTNSNACQSADDLINAEINNNVKN